MAKVRFYLKDSAKTETSIFARVSFKYYETNENGNKDFKQLKFATGETINPKYWDNEKQRATETKKFPTHPEFNQRLKDIETVILDVYRKMLNDGQGNAITPGNLRVKITEQLNKENKTVRPVSNKTGFVEYMKMIKKQSETGERTTKNGTRIKQQTITSYNQTINTLSNYETDKKTKLRFSDITIDFYNQLVKYLNDKNSAVNTIGKHIKNIKIVMKIAHENILTNNTDYSKKAFSKISEETQTIYLNETELLKIYEHDFSDDKKLDIVRDLFIIGCYTGLRFSDLKQLRKEHISDNVITIRTVKTGETVVIPLHWTVRAILSKYDYNLPRVISNQKFNEYIKTIGEKSKINDTIIISETRGGLRYDSEVNKYKLITAHTARRTFATNMYLNDIPTLAIMKITGHKSEKTFLKYIKVSPEENATKLLNHPFFNQSNLKVV
jgi:integrase